MGYTNEEIGYALKSQLAKGFNIKNISRWVYDIYCSHAGDLSFDQEGVLEELFRMEDDPQFELTEEQLHALADRLIQEGEVARLRDAEPSITAVRLDDHWLFCPDCLDAWESDSRESKVICPKCDQIFLNPMQGVE
jgi:hypothetical protein